MSADQLRKALNERHRGLDPEQAEQQATGEQHQGLQPSGRRQRQLRGAAAESWSGIQLWV
jgi:hypothetical protein